MFAIFSALKTFPSTRTHITDIFCPPDGLRAWENTTVHGFKLSADGASDTLASAVAPLYLKE